MPSTLLITAWASPPVSCEQVVWKCERCGVTSQSGAVLFRPLNANIGVNVEDLSDMTRTSVIPVQRKKNIVKVIIRKFLKIPTWHICIAAMPGWTCIVLSYKNIQNCQIPHAKLLSHLRLYILYNKAEYDLGCGYFVTDKSLAQHILWLSVRSN